MNRLRKYIVFASLFSLFACSKHIPSEFEIVGMRLSNSNSSGQIPVDTLVDSIPKRAYAIKMTFDEVMRIKRGGDPQENGFMNEDQLTSLNIISLNNFDDTHPVGSSLNSYFLTQLKSTATVATFISNGRIGSGVYKDGNYVDSWSSSQYFFLMNPPTSSNSQTFVIKFELSDGRSFCDTLNVKLY